LPYTTKSFIKLKINASNMNLSERGKRNVRIRWNRIHQKEIDYIRKNLDKTFNFKSRLCGYLAGDGNILTANGKTCTHYSIRFFPDHSSLIKPFKEAFIKTYNKNPKVKKLKNYYFITIDSKPIVYDLLSLVEFGTSNWSIPNKILTNDKNKIEWLRAFFDAEAHIHEKYIRIQSVNGKGLKQVKELLNQFSINSKIYEYVPKNKKWNKVYILNILRKKDKINYLKLIGFNHTIKLKKLNKNLDFALNKAAVA